VSIASAITDNLTRDLATSLDTINLAQVRRRSGSRADMVEVAFSLGYVVMEMCASCPSCADSPDR